MNTDFDNHIPEEILDEFAMEMLCEEEQAFWEEHLLVCNVCQNHLLETDDYIQVVKDAAAPTTELEKRRALAKPVMAATHAALLLAYVLGSHFMFLPR